MNWTPLIIHMDRRAFILNLLLIYEFWSTEIILINIHIVPSLDSEIFKLTPASFRYIYRSLWQDVPDSSHTVCSPGLFLLSLSAFRVVNIIWRPQFKLWSCSLLLICHCLHNCFFFFFNVYSDTSILKSKPQHFYLTYSILYQNILPSILLVLKTVEMIELAYHNIVCLL